MIFEMIKCDAKLQGIILDLTYIYCTLYLDSTFYCQITYCLFLFYIDLPPKTP